MNKLIAEILRRHVPMPTSVLNKGLEKQVKEWDYVPAKSRIGRKNGQ